MVSLPFCLAIATSNPRWHSMDSISFPKDFDRPDWRTPAFVSIGLPCQRRPRDLDCGVLKKRRRKLSSDEPTIDEALRQSRSAHRSLGDPLDSRSLAKKLRLDSSDLRSVCNVEQYRAF